MLMSQNEEENDGELTNNLLLYKENFLAFLRDSVVKRN